LKKYIETFAPEIIIVGGEYPAPPLKQFLAQVVYIA